VADPVRALRRAFALQGCWRRPMPYATAARSTYWGASFLKRKDYRRLWTALKKTYDGIFWFGPCTRGAA
jgi:hypothetical protein